MTEGQSGREGRGAHPPAFDGVSFDAVDVPARLRPPVVLVVDDQRAVRVGVGRLLAAGEPCVVVHHAASADEACDAFARHEPDVVVLDVDLGGDDGLALLPRMVLRARVLVLTSHDDAATRQRAAALGASGLVGKGESGAVLTRRVVELLNAPSPYWTTDPHSRGEQRPRRTREQAPGRRRRKLTVT